MGVSFYLPRQTTQVQTDWYWNASHKTQWSPTGVTTATCSLKTRHESLGLLNQAWESRSLGRILNLRLPSRNVWLRQRTDQRDQRDRAVSVESDTHWENAQFNIENLCINHCLNLWAAVSIKSHVMYFNLGWHWEQTRANMCYWVGLFLLPQPRLQSFSYIFSSTGGFILVPWHFFFISHLHPESWFKREAGTRSRFTSLTCFLSFQHHWHCCKVKLNNRNKTTKTSRSRKEIRQSQCKVVVTEMVRWLFERLTRVILLLVLPEARLTQL